MKALIILAFSLSLFSCGGEDPKPQFDCDELNKEASHAHELWQSFIHTPLNPNAAQYEKEKYFAKNLELKNDYIAKVKIANQHCK